MSEKVRNMFAEIAGKYDLLNDVLSLGIHKKWRRKAVALSNASASSKVLDCACGTGDFSFEFAKVTKNVVGTDFCEEMLVIAREKAKKMDIDIPFSQADAMDLPYPENTFDILSIGFGIRNVDNVGKAIAEMARVINGTGKIIILEFGQPKGMFKYVYNFYSNNIMPRIGRMLAKSEAAYTYLPETAAKFPCREEFLDIARAAYPFKKVEYHSLSFGIAYIYILEK